MIKTPSGASVVVSDIAVRNVRLCAAPLVITCDVFVGDVRINGVTLRRGRGLAIYVNLPSRCHDGHWRPVVEITAPELLDAVRQAVVTAALEATRYTRS